MPIPVASRFDGVAFVGCRVAAPASYGQAVGWADGIAFLMGRVTHTIYDQSNLPLANGPITIPVFRSEAGRALLVVVSPNEGTNDTDRIYIDVTLTGPAFYVVPATRLDERPVLDGATALPCPQARQRVQNEYATVFSLAVISPDDLHTITVTTSVASGAPRGVYRIAVYEVPRGALNPESNP